jgi:hypothetical protein
MIGHPLDASIASLRGPVFQIKFNSNSKTKNESPVETQCLRLTDAKPMHKTKNLTIIRNVTSKLGRNYLFVFLKKNNLIWITEYGIFPFKFPYLSP